MRRLRWLAAILLLLALALLVDRAHAGSGRMLRTAYCLTGHTRSGTPVGPGTVAVDPAVIPLGAHVWVEGYGYGRALDTGSAVRGYHVDVWMSSCSAALRSTRHGILVRWWT